MIIQPLTQPRSVAPIAVSRAAIVLIQTAALAQPVMTVALWALMIAALVNEDHDHKKTSVLQTVAVNC